MKLGVLDDAIAAGSGRNGDAGRHGASGSILCCSYEFPPVGGGGSRVVAGLTKQQEMTIRNVADQLRVVVI